MKGLTERAVRLDGHLVRPAETLVVQKAGYRGRIGTFRGLWRDGRLAVSLKCSQQEEVVATEHGAGWNKNRISPPLRL